MKPQKTYLCTGKYYKDGRLYEAGETITVDADSPVSSVWQSQEEPVKAGEAKKQQLELTQPAKQPRASDKSV